jgi:hypothetical protein
MTSSIFSRLGYNFTDTNSDVIEFSDKVVSHLNALPTLINTWQQEDIATSNTGGYFVNPLQSITTNIRNTSNTIIPLLSSAAQTSALQGSTGTITSLFASMNANLISISGNTGNNFIAHTDRISGVAPFSSTEDPSEFPYYKIAISTGKVMVYLIHQSDGITNSAPILGSFTSLFVGDELQTVLDTVSTYQNTINTSITYTTTLLGTPPNTYTYTTKTSNLSLATVQSMNNNVSYIIDTMDTRRTHDETFYRNSRAVLDDYNSVKQFNNMGETQDQLIQNYIGSDKLLSRLNG